MSKQLCNVQENSGNIEKCVCHVYIAYQHATCIDEEAKDSTGTHYMINALL